MSTTCAIQECPNPAIRRDWCQAHYARWRRHGDVFKGGPVKKYRPRGLSDAEAFAWFMPGDPPGTGCWDWTSVTNADGYGLLSGQPNVLATRVAYRIYHGELPDGQEILHSCDRPICVHPTHLRAGTRTDNMADMVRRGRHAPGEKHPNAKVTEDQVRFIRDSDLTLAELAELTGISFQSVSRIRRGERWKHVV